MLCPEIWGEISLFRLPALPETAGRELEVMVLSKPECADVFYLSTLSSNHKSVAGAPAALSPLGQSVSLGTNLDQQMESGHSTDWCGRRSLSSIIGLFEF